MKNYPRYYQKDCRCIQRRSDTTGIEVQTPPTAVAKYPLVMNDVIFPSKERFDEEVNKMEETNQDSFEQSVMAFCGRVQLDIDRPLTDLRIKRELEKKKPLTLKI